MTLLGNKYFLPYHYYDETFLRATEPGEVKDCLAKSEGSYVIHLWETFFKDIIPNIGVDFIANSNTPLAAILRGVA